MKDELWLRKIKEKLEGYSEPLPATGWERLEKRLSVSGGQITGWHKKREGRFLRLAVAAAAVLLLAVSSVSLWLLQNSVKREAQHTSTLALTNENPPASRSWVAAQAGISVGNERREKTVSAEKADEAIGQHTENAVAGGTDREATERTVEPEEARRDRYRPSGRNKLHLPERNNTGRGSRGWTVGLSVGNTGGLLVTNEGRNAGLMSDFVSGSPIYSDNVDLPSVANGVTNIPDVHELVFKDGMPYLQRRARKVADIDHKQPISFGVSVRRGLVKGFSVESGLTYTYLASDIRYEGSLETIGQKLHYIGIPVRVNWNFVDTKDFTMYVSAGGAVEKCVYGKIGTESEVVKPLQFSVMGAVGGQYNLNNRVGLYVEPGVSYFFDDGSSVQTIRKENPCSFTLQAGVRLTY